MWWNLIELSSKDVSKKQKKCFKQKNEVYKAKVLVKGLAQPLPLLLLSLYHLGTVWSSSSVGMHTLYRDQLFPEMYACFRCKAFSSGCVEFGFALTSPPNKILTLRMAFQKTMCFFPKNCKIWSWAACVASRDHHFEEADSNKCCFQVRGLNQKQLCLSSLKFVRLLPLLTTIWSQAMIFCFAWGRAVSAGSM